MSHVPGSYEQSQWRSGPAPRSFKAETETRAGAEKQLQSLKEKVTVLTQENSDLKRDMQEHEENFHEQLSTLQKKLESATNELSHLKKMITAMVASLVGEHKCLKPGKSYLTKTQDLNCF